jgi:hypothetical protein
MSVTAKQVYINVLTELVKEGAPTLYLDDYLYYFNKAISEYTKSRYEMYETNQQLADDLRFWKKEFESSSLIIPINSIYKVKTVNAVSTNVNFYRHLLSCIIFVTITRPIAKCSQKALTTEQYKVVRMSSEMKGGMLGNEYLKPTFYRPYFEIIENEIRISIGVIDNKKVSINKVIIEYLCNPEVVDLTEDEIEEEEEDNSTVLEFSKDVCEEITKITLKLILERGSNPRLQSNIAVNQAISDVTTGMKGGR